MIKKQNTSVFYLGFKTTYMYLHDTLIILVETNLHASCPGSGVVIGSMVSYLVDQYGHIRSVILLCINHLVYECVLWYSGIPL